MELMLKLLAAFAGGACVVWYVYRVERAMDGEEAQAALEDQRRIMELEEANAALRRDAITAINQRDELRLLINRRPALNAGLPAAYAVWTGQCYALDWLNARDEAMQHKEES